MKYQIKKLENNNFAVYEENKLKGRTYFIPYSDRNTLLKQSALTERFASDIVTVLSGEWKFRYYDKISRMPVNIDTDIMSFDSITVPSTWQRTGYESPCYLNTRYEFPVTLPDVPDEMSAGVYVKKFNINNAENKAIITFLGVCSSLTLYVNGKYVGYSEGSHNSAEFTLDGFVHNGENELLAIVSKWSNGTYLECQDMFRENGIFRDVYITENPKNYINDFTVKTEEIDDGFSLKVSAEIIGNTFTGTTFNAELLKGKKVIASKEISAASNVNVDFGVLKVEKWTAETPNLYTLILSVCEGESPTEFIKHNIGFRTVRIEGEKFYFNSQLIKFKGVNHHDTHETKGYVMNGEDLLKDIKLMKEFNVNAVRTSHYPPDPIFLNLCDEYGLYVIDEADIETHGTQVKADLMPTLTPNIISNDKAWLPRYEDRVMRMYERDKNHPSITMWSLGNESGGWKNHDACYRKLKEVSDIPVHYEGAIRTIRGSYDVISEMYQHPYLMEKIANHKLGKRYMNKPYFLCEYCHAMGVGPGSLEYYWSLIYAYDQLTGGCIWEWADHSVYDVNAKHKYTYGGDHGEKYHDSNFCVDGLFYPDRTPHTGAYEMKNVYRPVRCEKVGENIYRFRNTNSFIGTDGLKVKFELLQNGRIIDEGEVKLDISPLESKDITIEHKTTDSKGNYHITFIYSDKKDNLVAKEQITLSEKLPSVKKSKGEISVNDRKDHIVVFFKDGSAVISKKTGILESYQVDGKEYIADKDGFTANLYRAYIDNDRNIVKGWKKHGYDKLNVKLKSFEFEAEDGKVKIEAESDMYFAGKSPFEFEIKYTVYPDGTIRIKSEIERKGLVIKALDIPRFGVNVKLDKSLQNVEYFGLGEYENLCDFKEQSIMGIYNSTVDGLNVDYIRPQDNGNHGECRYVKLSDDDGRGIMFCADKKPFSFSAHNYSNETLEKAEHLEDISKENFVNVNIDGFMRGTGSNSCGPDVLSQYKIKFKDELEFSFFMVPIK